MRQSGRIIFPVVICYLLGSLAWSIAETTPSMKSIGGEVRLRGELRSDRDFDSSKDDKVDFVGQRVRVKLAGGTEHAKAVVQLQHTKIWGGGLLTATTPESSDVDLHQGYSVGREGLGLILSGTDYDQAEGFDITVDWSFLPKLAERVVSRFPFTMDVGIRRAEAGLHPDTPDKSPILGSVPELEGLYLACGLNSQGIMHSPAVGRLMAEYILGIGCDPAISLLDLNRFQNGALQKEGMLSVKA